MAKTFDIDIQKSIETGKLVYESENWLSKLRVVFITFMFLMLLFFPIAILLITDFSNVNEKAFSILVIFGICFIVYGFYRKLVENRLTFIHTGLSKQDAARVLVDFLEKMGAEHIRRGKDCILAVEYSALSYNNQWSKNLIFLLTEEGIYFNMTKSYPDLNPPVFFTHIFLKRDLEKRFREKGAVMERIESNRANHDH